MLSEASFYHEYESLHCNRSETLQMKNSLHMSGTQMLTMSANKQVRHVALACNVNMELHNLHKAAEKFNISRFHRNMPFLFLLSRTQ
jgi:hypothetical protein